MLLQRFFVLLVIMGTTAQLFGAAATAARSQAQLLQALSEREKNLLQAVQKNDTECTLNFFSMGVNPSALLDVTKIALIHAAAIGGSVCEVMLLLAKGTDVNLVDGYGWTPLMWAAKQGHLNVVRILLAAQANPALCCTAFKRTPLHIAVLAGHESVVAALVDTNTALNAQDKDGWSALMHAVNNGNIPLIKKLLYRDMTLYLETDLLPCANANVKSPTTGLTALHLAVLRGHNSIMHMLIGARADLNEVTREGKTALHLAALTNNRTAIHILRTAGAKQDMVDSTGLLADGYASHRKTMAAFTQEVGRRKLKPVQQLTPTSRQQPAAVPVQTPTPATPNPTNPTIVLAKGEAPAPAQVATQQEPQPRPA